VRVAEHFIKFFRQLPGLSIRELSEAEWDELLRLEDREEFRTKVDEYFAGLSEAQRERMAQFLYDKNQELLREKEEEESGAPGS
jgi:hypothetical protein